MPVPTPNEHHLTLNRLATIARLVASAAHEVNNALQVIGGSSPGVSEPVYVQPYWVA